MTVPVSSKILGILEKSTRLLQQTTDFLILPSMFSRGEALQKYFYKILLCFYSQKHEAFVLTEVTPWVRTDSTVN